MNDRCHNPKSYQFKNYGDRGIFVCDQWRDSFKNFVMDMGPRPDGMSLERIDNNKGYGPDNCRWATQMDQMNNTRVNRKILYQGEIKTLTQWAKHLGMDVELLRKRIARGWDVETAFTHLASSQRNSIGRFVSTRT